LNFYTLYSRIVKRGFFQNKIDYSILLKNHFEITDNVTSLFERNNCLIKECTFLRSKEINSGTLFISFLPVRIRRKKILSSKTSLLSINKIVSHLFNIVEHFGYSLEKRIVFLNLDKIGQKTKKKFQNVEHINSLFVFKNELFYNSGLTLFFLLFSIKNMSSLLAKYIAKYFKLLHRSKK
jgi:hypothetical protein